MAKNKKNRGVASVIVAQRAPHVATAEVVELFGTETAQLLYQAFHKLNAEHFEGQLGSPLVLITQPTSARAWADYCARDLHGLESRIRIAQRVIAKGMLFAFDVLLHEMIHAWQSEIVEDLEDGYRGHGPVFAKKCNEIGKALGLPPVGVKGRDGLPDCAYWPYIVRTPDYYGWSYAPAKRSKKGERKEKPKAEKTEREPMAPDYHLRLAMKLCAGLDNRQLQEVAELIAGEMTRRLQAANENEAA